jgi:hypothetical protein
MAGRRYRLHAGQKFLAVLDEYHAVAVRQQLLARAGDKGSHHLVRKLAFVGPEVEIGLRHVDLSVGEDTHAVIGH